ncbi:MAG: hypothetical protein MZV70_29340 [Desulfobacterales bacterium]|nr:hypothetical protein [Desulfobacterales bacterium]
MHKAGLIQRFHGGAGMASSTENVAYNERKVLCFEEKRRIAQMVAAPDTGPRLALHQHRHHHRSHRPGARRITSGSG